MIQLEKENKARKARRRKQRTWHSHFVVFRVAIIEGRGNCAFWFRRMERRWSESYGRWFWREPMRQTLVSGEGSIFDQ